MKSETLRYTVILERGNTGWGAHVPDLPGCIVAGKDGDEVLALIREAIEPHIDGLKRAGLPIPESLSEGEVVEIATA